MPLKQTNCFNITIRHCYLLFISILCLIINENSYYTITYYYDALVLLFNIKRFEKLVLIILLLYLMFVFIFNELRSLLFHELLLKVLLSFFIILAICGINNCLILLFIIELNFGQNDF